MCKNIENMLKVNISLYFVFGMNQGKIPGFFNKIYNACFIMVVTFNNKSIVDDKENCSCLIKSDFLAL